MKRRVNRRYRADYAMRKGKPLGKKSREVLIGHAIKRAYERYDKRFSVEQIEAMGESIRTNEGTFVETQSSSRSAWIVALDGVEYPVVYNKAFGCVVTLLPHYVLLKWKGELAQVPE